MRGSALAVSGLNVTCLLLACSSMLVAQQPPAATELSLPGRPIALKVYLGDLQITDRATADDGGSVRILAEGGRGFTLSAMLETVPTPLTSTQCRDERWPKMSSVPMKYEHLRFSEREGVALVEYEVTEFQGKPVHQKSVFAFWTAQDLCALVHVSKVNYQPSDDEYMNGLIKAARLEPQRQAAVSIASGTHANSIGGRYPSHITIDFGQGSAKLRAPSPSVANPAGTGVAAPAQSRPSPKPKLPSAQGRRIYFVAIGDFPDDQIQQLIQYYRERFGFDIQTLAAIPVDPSAMDSRRHQVVAERLISSIRNAFPKLANDSNAILVGFTSTDMYPDSMNWRFAFGWRIANVRTAVVSTARMDLHYPGEPSDVALPEIRLRKIVTKDIGILYYGLPQSNNPRSVLYRQILGIEELDGVSDDF